MKTNQYARKVWKLRHWVGLLAMLLLVSAEVWMVCLAGHGCGQVTTPPTIPAPPISDWFAAR
jgi:hypothetical protein